MICSCRKAISNILGKICFLWRKTPESTPSFNREVIMIFKFSTALIPGENMTTPTPDSRHGVNIEISSPSVLLLSASTLPSCCFSLWQWAWCDLKIFSNERSGWLLRSLLSDVWEAWFGILKMCIFYLDKLDDLAYPDHHDILIILVKMVLPGSSSPRLSATPF